MIIEGNQEPCLNDININEYIKGLEGTIDEKKAQELLVQFLQQNLGFTVRLVSGEDLFPFQEIAIKTMFKKDYFLAVWSRGLSKSYTTAQFAWLYALLNPGAKIAIIARVFRQSREIFKKIEEVAAKPEASLLAQCLGRPVHKNDEYSLQIGKSEIKALPLGEGEKLRGFRFTVLIIDEFLLMPEKIVTEVLMPFLSTNADPMKRQKIWDQETMLIKKGLMKESERTKFKNPKMIALSSASYNFEYLYKVYKEYIEKIRTGTEDGMPPSKTGENKLKGSYAVMQLSYKAAPSQLYNESLIEKSRSEMSEAQFGREFGAAFSDDSSGFYRMKTMNEASVPFGEYPCVEVKGATGGEYILAIDPSFAENEGSDFFAMVMLKKNEENKWVYVHSYAVAGGKLKDHIMYFYYLWMNFPIKSIVLDNAGGLQFINSINESKLFKDENISFEFINDVDFTDHVDYQKQLITAKKQYNPEKRRICYLQNFSNEWIRRANEQLQAWIEHKRIKFAADAQGIEQEYHSQISDSKVRAIVGKLNFFSEFEVGNMDQKDLENTELKQIELVERQYELIEMTKTQCALIVVKSTDAGNQTFGLPDNLKNTKGATKARKDLYTCLLMGSWMAQCYSDFIKAKIEEQSQSSFIPIEIK